MTTLRLTNQRGSLVGPLATTDARYNDERADAIGAALWDIQSSLQGLLDPADLAQLRATLGKYGSGAAPVSPSGVARGNDSARRADDARRDAAREAGRAAGAKVRANIEHNQGIARGYRDFWNQAERDWRESIPR